VAKFALANHLAGAQFDLWRMEDEPGASQDDVHSGSLQCREYDLLFIQVTNLELQ